MKIIKCGTLLTPQRVLENWSIIIREGKIAALEPSDKVKLTRKFEFIDASRDIVIPGLIDLHIHGGNGYDAAEGSYTSICDIAKHLAKYGTTAFLPTIAATSWDRTLQSLLAIQEAMKRGTEAAEVLGAHLEGPYLSPQMPGAMPPEHLRSPSDGSFKELIDKFPQAVKLMTLAPEIECAEELIKFLLQHKIVASLGHSYAAYDQVKKAIDWGLSHTTHIFNAMRGIHHREPGVAGAVLSDNRLTAEIIADGFHVHPKIIEMVIKLKGIDKVVLITDGVAAIGLPEGEYEFFDQKVIISKGTARLQDGRLAGSLLTLNRAIKNVQQFTGLPLKDVVRMATYNPAKVIGVQGRKGSIVPGRDADVVITDENLEVKKTLVRGNLVWVASDKIA